MSDRECYRRLCVVPAFMHFIRANNLDRRRMEALIRKVYRTDGGIVPAHVDWVDLLNRTCYCAVAARDQLRAAGYSDEEIDGAARYADWIAAFDCRQGWGFRGRNP